MKEFRVIWIAAGVALAARSVLGLAGPQYWDPSSTLDWIAVWTFSVALLLVSIAFALLALRSPRLRSVSGVAWTAAGAALLAAAANAFEDGLGAASFGTPYVIGTVLLLGAMIVLGVLFLSEDRAPSAWSMLLVGVGFATFPYGGGLVSLVGCVQVSRWRPVPGAETTGAVEAA